MVFVPFGSVLPSTFLLGLYFCLVYPSSSETSARIPTSSLCIGLNTWYLPVDFDFAIALIFGLMDVSSRKF